MTALARTPSSVWGLLFGSWLVALASSLAALFLGEVMGRTPCVLCWYQRACMFPLVPVLAIACYRSDDDAWRYALPLASLGGLIAAFHLLQYVGVVPASLVPCGPGPPCSGPDMAVAGIPIPGLSLVAFASIAGLLIPVARRRAA